MVQICSTWVSASHLGFGKEQQLLVRQPKASGAHGNLLKGFFAGDIQHLPLFAQIAANLQQAGALAHAGVAADQHHRARHQPAAEHPVKLACAR